MDLDPFILARIQFAANISFHILFPAITIGLAWVLFYFRVRYTLSRDEGWEYAYYFWVKIFALSFALGVVSGLTMSFQFGTNWPGFMEQAGNIAGPLLGYEVLTAFFLEASFLGIMLFGKNRVLQMKTQNSAADRVNPGLVYRKLAIDISNLTVTMNSQARKSYQGEVWW